MTHSVRLSVCPSVILSFFSPFDAPAHPHATSARVYGLVLISCQFAMLFNGNLRLERLDFGPKRLDVRAQEAGFEAQEAGFDA